MRQTTEGNNGEKINQPLASVKADSVSILKRLEKMAMYDAKDYFNFVTNEDGTTKITLKADEDVDWDILESLEVNDNKVRIKFPDRTKAIDKYIQMFQEILSAEPDEDNETITYIPRFLGDEDAEN